MRYMILFLIWIFSKSSELVSNIYLSHRIIDNFPRNYTIKTSIVSPEGPMYSMLYMIFQSGGEPVLNLRILSGFKAILEIMLKYMIIRNR